MSLYRFGIFWSGRVELESSLDRVFYSNWSTMSGIYMIKHILSFQKSRIVMVLPSNWGYVDLVNIIYTSSSEEMSSKHNTDEVLALEVVCSNFKFVFFWNIVPFQNVLDAGTPDNRLHFFFDRGHPIVLILTNNIQYLPSDTTRLYIHQNVITGLLVLVSQDHLSGPQY